MGTFRFFTDVGLTTPLDTLSVTVPASGGSSADMVFGFGSISPGKLLQAASNPGVDMITLSVSDATPGSGINASHIKLSTSLEGLDDVVAGSTINLTTSAMSTNEFALEIFVRITSPALLPGVYSEIALITNDLVETSF